MIYLDSAYVASRKSLLNMLVVVATRLILSKLVFDPYNLYCVRGSHNN